MLNPDRYLSPVPDVRDIARALYEEHKALPLVCPHGHVDPRLLALDEPFPDPHADRHSRPLHRADALLAGRPMETLGIPRLDGGQVEKDPRSIWQTFADHFYLFRGTPSGAWLADELRTSSASTSR